MPALPSPVLAEAIPDRALNVRQAATTIVQSGSSQPQNNCPGQYNGGTLAGAILGTFFGTLLLIYLWSTIWQNHQLRSEVVTTEKRRVTRRHKSRSGSGASSVRRPSRVYGSHS